MRVLFYGVRWVLLGLLLAMALPGHAEDLLTSQMVDEAKMWQSKGRTDLAADIWRRLLISNPQHGVALVGLAQTQIRAGNLAEAEALLARASRLARKPAGLEAASSALAAAKLKATPVSPPVAAAEPPPTVLRRAEPAAPTSGMKVQSNAKESNKPISREDEAVQKTAPKKPTASPQPRPPAVPVPPPSQEVRVTPIPLRSVDPLAVPAEEEGSDTLRLRESNPLTLSPANGAAPVRTAETNKSGVKNKPRPSRPAPALNPTLPDR